MCESGRCVSGGSRSLLKLSHPGRCWQAGKSWERCRRRVGAGGSSAERITAVSVALYFCENNALALDGEQSFVVQYRQ